LSRLFARGDNVGRVVAVAAVLAVVFSVGLDVATLTRAPEPYGDEAWVGSAVWSFTHGHGLRPAIAVGSGIYDGTFDHWIPRVGILPQIVAQLVAGTSFTAYRAGSLVVSLFGLGVLALGLRRRYGTSVAALAAAAAATTWIYFAASHYIRWDDVTFLLGIDDLHSARHRAALAEAGPRHRPPDRDLTGFQRADARSTPGCHCLYCLGRAPTVAAYRGSGGRLCDWPCRLRGNAFLS
jgi:hypothetical protein